MGTRTRIRPRDIAMVALGDAAGFVALVILGWIEHGIIQGEAFLRTALPFAAVWFAASPWLGAYRTSTLRDLKSTAWRIPLIWLPCGLVAVMLRAWLADRTFILAFALVAIGVQVVLLVAWRVAFLMIARRLSRP